jgi:hypothetical protein
MTYHNYFELGFQMLNYIQSSIRYNRFFSPSFQQDLPFVDNKQRADSIQDICASFKVVMKVLEIEFVR